MSKESRSKTRGELPESPKKTKTMKEKKNKKHKKSGKKLKGDDYELDAHVSSRKRMMTRRTSGIDRELHETNVRIE